MAGMEELDARARAQVASKAQSEAHKTLRRKYAGEYQELYQANKARLTDEYRARVAEPVRTS